MVSFSKKIKRKTIMTDFTKKHISSASAFRACSYSSLTTADQYKGSVLIASPFRGDTMPTSYYHALLMQDMSYKRMQQEAQSVHACADIALSGTQASSVFSSLGLSTAFSVERNVTNIADAFFAADIIDRLYKQ